MKSIEQHNNDVTKIQQQLKEANGQIALKRSSTCCSRSFKYKQNKTQIDVSQLNQIIELNLDKMYVVLEPLVSMEQFIKKSTKHKVTTPVITEFKHMTFGGAIQGLGGESSSFNHGFIDEAVIEYELLLADGTLITATNEKNKDLYNALPGSFGSIAIITKIKLKLIHAPKYVKLRYSKLTSIEEVHAAFDKSLQNKNANEFVECIATSKTDFRLAEGIGVDKISLKDLIFHKLSLKYPFSKWYLPHVIEKTNKPNYVEYIKYDEYVFRWDRGAFWLGLHWKHNLWNRLFIGPFLSCANLYKHLYKRTLMKRDHENILQDVLLPMSKMQNFFRFLDKNIQVYPLWLIPVKAPKEEKLFSIPCGEGYVDFGVWGPPKGGMGDFIKRNREIEFCLRELNGKKWMWGQVYSTEEEFWSDYNKQTYTNIRKKYKSDNKLVNIYSKVSELFRSTNKN